MRRVDAGGVRARAVGTAGRDCGSSHTQDEVRHRRWRGQALVTARGLGGAVHQSAPTAFSPHPGMAPREQGQQGEGIMGSMRIGPLLGLVTLRGTRPAMVFFFQASNGWQIYMGKVRSSPTDRPAASHVPSAPSGQDKNENEDLIKYSFPTDVWFHVDDLSSAHVYLRMPFVRLRWSAGPLVRRVTRAAAGSARPWRTSRRRSWSSASRSSRCGVALTDAIQCGAGLTRARGRRKTPLRAPSGRRSTSCVAGLRCAAPAPT